jgi:hypothetical protein
MLTETGISVIDGVVISVKSIWRDETQVSKARPGPPSPVGTTELLSAVPTGLEFARMPYPALRAGLLSAVPSGLNPGLVGSHADTKVRRILNHLRHD